MSGFDERLCETFTAPTNSKLGTLSLYHIHSLLVSSSVPVFSLVAVIKYWGKGDLKLNTPMNSSASITLDQVTHIPLYEYALCFILYTVGSAHHYYCRGEQELLLGPSLAQWD